MNNHIFRAFTSPQCNLLCITCQLCRHLSGQRPVNDCPQPQVDNHWQIKPADFLILADYTHGSWQDWIEVRLLSAVPDDTGWQPPFSCWTSAPDIQFIGQGTFRNVISPDKKHNWRQYRRSGEINGAYWCVNACSWSKNNQWQKTD